MKLLPVLENTIRFLLPETGEPVAFGCLEVYELDEITPKVVYRSTDETDVHENPIELDELGRAALFADADIFVVVKDANGAVIDQGALYVPISTTGGEESTPSEAVESAYYNHVIFGGAEIEWTPLT